MMSKVLGDQVIAIAEDYLGPAGDRFVRRQVQFHFKKPVESLETSDITQLSEWIKVSLALLTEDKSMVDECEKRILELK